MTGTQPVDNPSVKAGRGEIFDSQYFPIRWQLAGMNATNRAATDVAESRLAALAATTGAVIADWIARNVGGRTEQCTFL